MHAESAWRQEKRVRLALREVEAKEKSYKRVWDHERTTDDPWQHRQGWKKLVTWEDALIAVYGEQWRKAATNWEQWTEGEDDYVYQFLEMCDLGGQRLRADKQKAKAMATARKKERRERVVAESPFEWRKPRGERFLLDVKGDSSLVVRWCNGTMRCVSRALLTKVACVQQNLYEAHSTGQVRTARAGGDWVRHVLREHNKLADEHANVTMNRRADVVETTPLRMIPRPDGHLYLRCSFDGGRRSATVAAAAYAIEVWDGRAWKVWRKVGKWIPGVSAIMSEMTAIEMFSGFLVSMTRALSEQWHDIVEGLAARP